MLSYTTSSFLPNFNFVKSLTSSIGNRNEIIRCHSLLINLQLHIYMHIYGTIIVLSHDLVAATIDC
jgi:hypothetical protein